MNSAKFRKELIKIMPRYKWTIHRNMPWAKYLSATGKRVVWVNEKVKGNTGGLQLPLFKRKGQQTNI